MKIVVQDDWFSREQCMNNPTSIYVFGDNAQRVGNGGQAQIRGCSNVIGVATKRTPSMDDEAFFNDSFEDLKVLFNDLSNLHYMHSLETYDHMTLIFPVDGLGTGLSELPKRAPFLNKQLELLLDKYFNIITRFDGTLVHVKR